MFSCTPSEALEQDEDLVYEIVRARMARNSAWAFEAEGVKMTTAQAESYKRMHDALDARDKRLGIPEEL
jgi:hypothetical protein